MVVNSGRQIYNVGQGGTATATLNNNIGSFQTDALSITVSRAPTARREAERHGCIIPLEMSMSVVGRRVALLVGMTG